MDWHTREYPKQRVLVNNQEAPITSDSISTVVSLRENGIADCKLIASNKDGKTYLGTLHIGDTLEVQYQYEEVGIWKTIFSGSLWEMSPSFMEGGEMCQVVAYGKGYPLKLMRVADEYGIQGKTSMFEEQYIDDDYPVDYFSAISTFLPVNGFTAGTSQWHKNGASPYLDDDDEVNYIYGDNDVGAVDETYTFSNSIPARPRNTIFLFFKMRNVILSGSGNSNKFIVFYKINGGDWIQLDEFEMLYNETEWTTKGKNITSILNTEEKINNFRIKLMFSAHGSGENESQLQITYSYLECLGEGTSQWTKVGDYPWLHDYSETGNYIYTNVVGAVDNYYTFEDVPWDETAKLSNVTLRLYGKGEDARVAQVGCYLYWDGIWHNLGSQPFWGGQWAYQDYIVFPLPHSTLTWDKINTFKLMIKIESNTFDTNIYITKATIFVKAVTGKKCTLKRILTDSSKGIVPKYIKKIFGGNSSGHNIDTSLIYDYSDEFKYAYFPYELGFDCLQDLIKIQSAMEATKDTTPYITWKGIHWIVTPDNKLIIAPVGDHTCGGLRNDIESAWVTRPLDNPIVVKEDMITELFKRESHIANYVIVAGKYMHPLDDIWTESISDWVMKLADNNGEIPMGFKTYDAFHWGLDSSKAVKGLFSILTHVYDAPTEWAFLYRPFNIELNKLIGLRTYPVLGFQMVNEGEALVKLRLYSSVPSIYPDPDAGNYYEYNNELTSLLGNEWSVIEAPLKLDDETLWTKHGYPSIGSIKYILFYFWHSTTAPLPYVYNYWIDDIRVMGDTLRGAYDSTLINNPSNGCRMLIIKNSLAQTDTFDSDDDSSSLAQQALMELFRSRVNVVTGNIQLPLMPELTGGQIVHVHSEQLENGTYTINGDFRIYEVEHNFEKAGAFTIIKITNDLQHSSPLRLLDPYDIIIRAINPDFQTKTFASMRTGAEFDISLAIIAKDYPS